jgi:hypothetical protein
MYCIVRSINKLSKKHLVKYALAYPNDYNYDIVSTINCL